MNEILKLCGAALIAVMSVIILRQFRPEFALFISITAGVGLFISALMIFKPSIAYIKEIVETTAYGPYITTLMKALGIALTVQTAADICRDAGESSVAGKLELIGKAEIMLISLPLLKSIIMLTGEILFK